MEAADQSQTENYGWMGLRMTKQGYGNSANLNDLQAPFSPVDLFLQTEAASSTLVKVFFTHNHSMLQAQLEKKKIPPRYILNPHILPTSVEIMLFGGIHLI